MSNAHPIRTVLHRRWFAVLAIVYLGLWIALAITPLDRSAWALENLLTVVIAVILVATHWRFTFSRFSYALLFVFLLLHAIGAHYTYARVPYDAFLARMTGWSPAATFHWERNHYDRFVHFGYGLLIAYPAREIALRIASLRGFWGYFVPFLFVVASSAIFELLEWLAAVVFGGDLGMTYLGTQGDPWDAHKDMALALLGSVLAMGAIALVNARLQRDFAREWVESLRVKDARPLGEDALQTGRA